MLCFYASVPVVILTFWRGEGSWIHLDRWQGYLRDSFKSVATEA